MKRPHNSTEIAVQHSILSSKDLESPSKPVQIKNDTLKWFALAVLVLQNSGLILFMRLSRVKTDSSNVNLYCISTAVAVSEASKLILSAILLFTLESNCEAAAFWGTIRRECKDNWR